MLKRCIRAFKVIQYGHLFGFSMYKLVSVFLYFSFNIALVTNAQNVYDARQSVILEAQVLESPKKIILSWVLDTANGGFTIWRKLKNDNFWGDSLVYVGPNSTSWSDTSISVGVGYEYKVIKSLPAYTYPNGIPNYGTGYIYAGIKLPPVHHRGSCLLVIDSSFKGALNFEINRMLTDFEADGWITEIRYVDKSSPVTLIKSYIKTWSDQTTDPNQTVFLFGRVPVPYSGDFAPDGHWDDHSGAWPCDGYYANMDGIWKDSLVNMNGPGTRNDNVPGDGKFDNRIIPTPVKIQIGRVDFANMNKFPETESQLLKRYLDKDHAWRTGKTPVMERALVDNNFNDLEGLGQAGWKNFAPMFGYSKVKDLQYRQTLSNQSYMWSYGCGGGGPESASDISSTSNFTTDSLQTIFTMLFGSYFGDWDYPNNFLRAAIASRTCLASTWGNRPVWLFHHMAMGEPIGYSAKITMNNRGLYTFAFYGGYYHTALLGDPTLRMHMLKPVENLVASQNGQHVKLDWQDPAIALGYFVYKKSSSDSTYQLLNQNPISLNFFIDSCAGSGLILYLVKSMELRTSASGTYYNLSQGASTSIQSNISAYIGQSEFTPTVYFDAFTAINSSKNGFSYEWDFGDGKTSMNFQPNHLYKDAGNYTVCLKVNDGCQVDNSCQVISVASSLPNVIPNIEDVVCNGDSSGSIILNITGGAPGISFKWTNSTITSQFLENIPAGNYYCSLKSVTGRDSIYGPYTVGQPPTWILNEMISNASQGLTNGAIFLSPDGGCLPYQYLWDNGQTTPFLQNLIAGNYSTTITDCNGCSVKFCGLVELVNGLIEHVGIESYKLFPNPAKEQSTLQLKISENLNLSCKLIDAYGRMVIKSEAQGKDIAFELDLSSLSPGSYWILIESSKGTTIFPLTKM